MDDDKKKTIEIEVALLIILIILIALAPAVWSALNAAFAPYVGPLSAYVSDSASWGKTALGILVGVSFPVSLVFLIGIVYSVEQTKRVRKKEAQKHDIKVETAFESGVAGDPALANRWETVQKHIASDNQSDWKQSIIEADIILEDLLTKMGYQGFGVGDKLNRVLPGDMATFNQAVEAHKVRNAIAHDGSGLVLSHQEANRVIHLYKKVFEEFYYI